MLSSRIGDGIACTGEKADGFLIGTLLKKLVCGVDGCESDIVAFSDACEREEGRGNDGYIGVGSLPVANWLRGLNGDKA